MLDKQCPVLCANLLDQSAKEDLKSPKRQIAFLSFDFQLAIPIISQLFEHANQDNNLFSFSTEKVNDELWAVYNWPIMFACRLQELLNVSTENLAEVLVIFMLEFGDIQESLALLLKRLSLFNSHLIIYFKIDLVESNELQHQIARLIALRSSASLVVGSSSLLVPFLHSLLVGEGETKINSLNSFSILKNWDSLEKIKLVNEAFPADEFSGLADEEFVSKVGKLLPCGKSAVANNYLDFLNELIGNEALITSPNNPSSPSNPSMENAAEMSPNVSIKTKQKEAISNFFQSLLQKTKQKQNCK